MRHSTLRDYVLAGRSVIDAVSICCEWGFQHFNLIQCNFIRILFIIFKKTVEMVCGVGGTVSC